MKLEGIFLKKSMATVTTLGLGMSLILGNIAPPKAEAFDITGVLIGSAVQYSYFNKQLKYYDNEGRDAYFTQLQNQHGVNDDPFLNDMLDDIMGRLSASIAERETSIKEKPYNYFVNSQDTFNAFCTLGHNLSVNTGLFALLNNHEDEIAFVVAHELVHGQKNHPIGGYKKAIPFSVLTQIYNAQGNGYGSELMVNTIAKYAAANTVTKPQEWEADNIAFDYAVRADYNPGAGAAVWQRVIEKKGQSSRNFVGDIFSPSDHPGHEERRDNYAKKLSEFSNKNVAVADGVIKIRGKELMKTADSSAMSGKERSYLIAGNLAAVYHQHKTAPKAYVENGVVKMGVQPIVLPIEGELGADRLVEILNQIK